MTFPLTTAQTLKTFAGAVLFGLGLDLANHVTCHVHQLAWFVLQGAAKVVIWGVLAGWQASQIQILGHTLYPGCPLELALSLRPILDVLGAAF